MGFQTISQARIRTLTNAVVRAGNIVQREGNRLFRSFGITAAHFNVLNMLAEDPGGVRASDISRYLVVDASSMTYTLDQLEKLGWVARKRESEDRRAIQIVLTAAGKKMHAKILPVYNAGLDALNRALGDAEIGSSLMLLARLPDATVEAVDAVTQALGDIPASVSKTSKLRSS